MFPSSVSNICIYCSVLCMPYHIPKKLYLYCLNSADILFNWNQFQASIQKSSGCHNPDKLQHSLSLTSFSYHSTSSINVNTNLLIFNSYFHSRHYICNKNNWQFCMIFRIVSYPQFSRVSDNDCEDKRTFPIYVW